MSELKKDYTILAVETSLDDTCAAVTVDDRVISNVVASQVKFHEEFGGTVPHVARRKHLEWIDDVVLEALRRAGIYPIDHHPRSLEDKSSGYLGGGGGIDAVAVTYGPGLAPSLEVGIRKAKSLAREWKKPFIAVNHMEGHLLSSFAKNSKGNGVFANTYSMSSPRRRESMQITGMDHRLRGDDKLKIRGDDMGSESDNNKPHPQFPALGFLISGGHTMLVLMRGFGDYVLLGETLDDAAGEAYDKVARMLKLGYPGGPILSELAKKGEVKYEFPEPMLHRKDLNFSFSGLKTAALYKLRKMENIDSGSGAGMTRRFCEDFAASFQQAVLKMMARRLRRAIEMYEPKMILLGGGVVSNVVIRNQVRKVARRYGLMVYIPYSAKLFTDNAAMIGVTAWYQAQRGEFWGDLDELDRVPGLSF